jgi:hypothetical protein
LRKLPRFDSPRKEKSDIICRLAAGFYRINDRNHLDKCGCVMAEDSEAEKPQEIRFMPPPQVWRYLNWLARNTLLGKTEQEVARQVLIAKLSEMRQESYRDPPNR